MLKLLIILMLTIYAAFIAPNWLLTISFVLGGLSLAVLATFGLDLIQDQRWLAFSGAAGFIGIAGTFFHGVGYFTPEQALSDGRKLLLNSQYAYWGDEVGESTGTFRKRFLYDCQFQQTVDQAKLAADLNAALHVPVEVSILMPSAPAEVTVHPCRQLAIDTLGVIPKHVLMDYPAWVAYGKSEN